MLAAIHQRLFRLAARDAAVKPALRRRVFAEQRLHELDDFTGGLLELLGIALQSTAGGMAERDRTVLRRGRECRTE